MTVPESTRRINKEVMLTEPHSLWQPGTAGDVEYFPSEYSKLVHDSVANPNYMDEINWLINGCEGRIAIDLEWRPNFSANHPENPVSVIQMATKNGILVLRHPPQMPGDPNLKKFLMEHKFIAKGCGTDSKKLREKFGDDFKIDMLDFEKLYLTPNGLSTHFDSMVVEFYKPSTIEFKDKNVSRSNWEAETLSTQQVLYAGFDAIALYNSYQNAIKRYPTAEAEFIKNGGKLESDKKKQLKMRKKQKESGDQYDRFKQYLINMMPNDSGRGYWLSRNFWPLLNENDKKDPLNCVSDPLVLCTTKLRGPVFEYLCGSKGVDMSHESFAKKLQFWEKEKTPREVFLSDQLDNYRKLGVAPYDAIQGVFESIESGVKSGVQYPWSFLL